MVFIFLRFCVIFLKNYFSLNMEGDEEDQAELKAKSTIPTFSQGPTFFKGRIICQIYFESTSKKHLGRNHFEKITNLGNFKNFSRREPDNDHKYNEVQLNTFQHFYKQVCK